MEARRVKTLLSKPVDWVEQPIPGSCTIDAAKLQQALLSPSASCLALGASLNAPPSAAAAAAVGATSNSPMGVEWAANYVFSHGAASGSQGRPPAGLAGAAPPSAFIQLDLADADEEDAVPGRSLAGEQAPAATAAGAAALGPGMLNVNPLFNDHSTAKALHGVRDMRARDALHKP